METVDFVHMADGTQEEYQFLEGRERQFTSEVADRILEHLASLDKSATGYKISRLGHCLQTAIRAERDGADEEMVVAALLHDIGDMLAPYNHGDMAAAILKPYVSERTHWIIRHHGIFQTYYYVHHFGEDRNIRDRYAGHAHYQATVDFCHKWDQTSFDPEYETPGLDYFEPMVRRLFAREPFLPDRT